LLADKAPEERLARIKNPAGLDLGAELPEEVALSILAEIVRERRARTSVGAGAGATAAAAPRSPRRVSLAVAGAPAAAAGPGEARDPVCGMTVTIASAAHRAEHDGRTYYFCCGGCRTRFLAAPAQYLTAEARA
jgi:xanthine dehydrogenase accessory factor